MADKISDDEIESILKRFDAENPADGKGAVLGKVVPDFTLTDQSGASVKLSDVYKNGPVVLALFPNDFSLAATSLLVDFRDAIEEFRKFGVQILAVSSNSIKDHAQIVVENSLPFRLLSDADNRVSRTFYGSGSFWLLEQGSRGIFLVSNKGVLLHRAVEPMSLTHRKADKLVSILNEMRVHKFL